VTNQVLKCSIAIARSDGGHLPNVIQVALSGMAWFLAVAWLDFSDGLKVGLVPALVIGLFVMYLTLFLLAAPVRLQQVRSHWSRATRRG
jgi:hypothetical protein